MSNATRKVRAKAAPVRRPGGRTAEVSTRIFDTVIAALVRGGLADCTFQTIAAEAGVDRSTLYRRWPDRSALVLDAIAARVDADIALSDTGSLAGDLSYALNQLARFLRSPVGRAALGAAMEAPPGGAAEKFQRSLWDRRWSAIEVIFQRAVARGEISSAADSEAILGAAAGAMYFRLLVTGRPADSDWIKRVVAVLVRP
jgi:AcrR family transcriptional regulator